MQVVIGIDPGSSGGIVRLDGRAPPLAEPMPKTERDLWLLVHRWCGGIGHAFIEHVHSMPKQGVASTFTFGVNYGLLRMALIASGTSFEKVQPTKWQREFGLLKRGDETKVAKKNRHKAVAQELFPSVKITHAIADALLIAEWGRRQQEKR